MSQSDITGVHLQWPMHRAGRPFVVHVVEPDQYDPTSHTPIFNAVINYLLAPPPRELLGVGHSSTDEPPDPFDLVVFPEAFVSADAFVKALQVIARAGSTGCIHIGLRPTEDNTTHLFTVALISGLLSRISGLGVVEGKDLQAFSSEPRREFRRLFGLIYAAMAGCSSAA